MAGPPIPMSILDPSPSNIRVSSLAEQSPIDPAADRGLRRLAALPRTARVAARPSADEDGLSGVACRVHRRIRYWNTDQVNQGQAEADGDGGKALGRAIVGRSHDDQQEECGQNDFRDQTGQQRIAARRMYAVSVRSESTANVEAGLAAGDHLQNTWGRDGTQNLGEDIRDQLGRGKSFAHQQHHTD